MPSQDVSKPEDRPCFMTSYSQVCAEKLTLPLPSRRAPISRTGGVPSRSTSPGLVKGCMAMTSWAQSQSCCWSSNICRYSIGSLARIARLESRMASRSLRACAPNSAQPVHSSIQSPSGIRTRKSFPVAPRWTSCFQSVSQPKQIIPAT